MNFDNIKLEKGMYATSKGFTKTLEELDPSNDYIGTPLEGLDAYQRQLKRFDIKVGGHNSDAVEKFFRTTDSAALFPEYVSRAVAQGLNEANVIPDIIAATTVIDGMDYRSITSVPSNDDLELKHVGEGSVIPQTIVKTNENLVKLHKRGRMLVASYEAIRFQRLDLFTVTLRQIGAYIARSQLADAVDVIINGDGNANSAAVINTATADTLTYKDMISLWNSFSPYEMNVMLASSSAIAEILNISQFQNPLTGINFQGTGKLSTPLGAYLIKSSSVPEDKIIALDKNCALEMVKAGEIITDFDKLIDRQLERAAITSIAGFAKIFSDASKVLSI